jgi:heat shock protein HslJ
MKEIIKIILIVLGSIFLILILAGIVTGVYDVLFKSEKTSITIISKNDPLNMVYTINGEDFTLFNGKAENEMAPGSATKNELSVFGEPVYGDLNNDGVNDAAVLLVNNPGGSGTFYYAVLAINFNGVYKATNALLLGDRIAPQTVEIQDGRAVYNYAERKAGEDFSVPPSMGKSLWINLDLKTGQIGEWVKDFEGEADTSKMNLEMKTWNWIQTQLNSDTTVSPNKPNLFSLTFNKDGTFSAHTDCNSVGGKYLAKDSKLIFSQMMSTLMYCDGSQESDYTKMLSEVSGFSFTSRGELLLDLGIENGTMFFR